MAIALTVDGINDLISNGTAVVWYVGLGTGEGTPSISDTGITSGSTDRAQVTVSLTDNIVNLEAFFTNSQAVGTWTEFGFYSDSSGGTFYGRGLLSSEKVKSNARPFLLIESLTVSNT
jgi:hypothetical protein